MINALKRAQQSKKWEYGYTFTRRNMWLRQRRINKFKLDKNSKILDLGCGDGLDISILTKLGYKNLTGVDPSSYLLGLAKINNPNVKFYPGSFEKLPFRAWTFSVVFIDSALHHNLNQVRALKEIRRVLKPDGLFCFIEPHKSLFRSTLDLLCTWPISQFFPVLKKRRITYLEERPLMTSWLNQEAVFLELIKKNKFKKVFLKTDLLGILGKYTK